MHCDPGKNDEMTGGKEGDISKDDSSVKVLVVPTNEELVIAKDTYQLVSQS